MTARVQRQIKQIWLKQEDDENIEKVVNYLRSIGVDVEPDNRRAQYTYSHSKVIRWMAAYVASAVDGWPHDKQPDA